MRGSSDRYNMLTSDTRLLSDFLNHETFLEIPGSMIAFILSRLLFEEWSPSVLS